MSDRDLLERASQALRETHDGRFAGSGFTRGQIMKRLHNKRRRRLLGWIGLSPVAALVAGSAWAQVTHSWPQVWHGVRGVLVALQLESVGPTPSTQPSSRSPVVPTQQAAPPAVPEPPVAPETAATEASEVTEARQAEPELAPSERGPRSQAPSARPALRDPELAEFRKAHDARFGGAIDTAHELYSRYLERYPNGRFVPEARYNLALIHLRRGQVDDARRELQPFAEGRFGNYRQQQAQALMDALRERAAP